MNELKAIDRFVGAYSFLSNFHIEKVEYQERIYDSAEHAYQAAKTLNSQEKNLITNAKTPGQAKNLGRKATLRSNWESIKLQVMEDILRQKFKAGTELAQELLATGNAVLTEGNYWNDTFWGVCRGRGKNHLGRLLMKIRDELTQLEQQ